MKFNLDQLDNAKNRPGSAGAIVKMLRQIGKRRFQDAPSLVQLHEILLFLRAYPQGASITKLTESLLKSFPERIELLRKSGVDISPFDHPEVSGIAGTSVSDTFSFNIVSWLIQQHPAQVSFDWDWFEDENRLAQNWPRFMPLLEEDSFVEANVPYLSWLRAARIGKREVAWMVEQFERLQLSKRERAELFDSLKLYVRWKPSHRATRTGMRLTVKKLFYHRGPLLERRDVDLREELEKTAPAYERLSSSQGRRMLDMARETSTVRYRELYGFTHGDENRVLKAHLGRGVDLFVFGLPPDRRLPLRAYHAALIFKNGVPVGYFEGLTLFERMESGFNFYYSFRAGETAWIYASTLNVFRHLLNVTAFSLDPYQIGYENDEGIESGAFWFYRKLGFRPTRKDLLRLAEAEEQKIAKRRNYRTSNRLLRRLAAGPMIFELEAAKKGDWDRFVLRKIGFAVQRRMATRYNGAAIKIREDSIDLLCRKLGLRPSHFAESEQSALLDFAVVLALVSDLGEWSRQEKQLLRNIIRAKAGPDEARYLKLMQQHSRLRSALIKLGSG